MARLEIIGVENSDRGEYRALAKNKHGEGVAKINLNFEGSGKPKYGIKQYFINDDDVVYLLKLLSFEQNTRR